MVPPRPAAEHHASLPNQYAGEPAGCCNFMFACELYFEEFSEMTSKQWITVVIQWLTGWALDWDAAVW